MMTNRIPKSTVEEIHNIQHKFIWGDTEEHKKIHVICWNTITTSKSHGGLGLRNLESLNIACLMKLGWNIVSNDKDLCCEVLGDKYNCQEDLQSVNSKAGDSSLWKEIIKADKDVRKFGYWNVVDGTTIRAWEDNWLGEEMQLSAIKHLIPTEMVGAKVVDLVNNQGE
ncbi:unnamed protein product [Lathyrus sativus]|nr:unnamed protein product [Lathyrus sativus]